ncbi:TIGR01440 family protein [Tetragenococcus halophilus]|uniref:TIGR01440 family protein n=1 Tax=Tetragenococcus halophilus TaxID=51669 RepID=UPI00300FD13C
MCADLIENQIQEALDNYFKNVDLKKNSLFVLGCSTSEVLGKWMGSDSNQLIGNKIITTILPILHEHQINLAVQGCQHINRALLMEREVAESRNYEIVSVVPALHAGGAAQVAAYQQFTDPVEVEHIFADGGMDIGDTQIGMHVKFVQIPIKTSIFKIGEAHTTFLSSRPKLIGGVRAIYDPKEIAES